ncbi:ATPase/histidine kinase/DNA gyrase B/HSP90 domain protein [Ostertagia ostertagi]
MLITLGRAGPAFLGRQHAALGLGDPGRVDAAEARILVVTGQLLGEAIDLVHRGQARAGALGDAALCAEEQQVLRKAIAGRIGLVTLAHAAQLVQQLGTEALGVGVTADELEGLALEHRSGELPQRTAIARRQRGCQAGTQARQVGRMRRAGLAHVTQQRRLERRAHGFRGARRDALFQRQAAPGPVVLPQVRRVDALHAVELLQRAVARVQRQGRGLVAGQQPGHVYGRFISLHGADAAERLLADLEAQAETVDADELPYLSLSYAVWKARVLRKSGQPRQALQVLRATLEAVTRKPGFEVLPYARVAEGRLHRELGQWQDCVQSVAVLTAPTYSEWLRIDSLYSTAVCRAKGGMPGAREDIATLDTFLPRLRNAPNLLEDLLTAQAQALSALGEHAAAFDKISRARQATLERIAKANEEARQRVETAYQVAAKDKENAELKASEQLAQQRRWVMGVALAIAVVVLAVVAELLRRQSAQRRQLTPAHALGMLAEVAAAKVPAEARPAIDAIRRSSTSLSDLLDSLFDLSRLESDRYEPSVGPVSLGDVFDDLRSQFTVAAISKGLRLSIDHVDATVRSDAHLLRRMLMNLLSNAIKYTPKGSVQVHARRQAQDWVITVTDTGPGIPAEQQEAAFSEYVRLDASGGTDGLGIGLAIVKRSAMLLGHQLALSSTVGRGSCFTLGVPAIADSAEIADTPLDAGGTGQVIGLVDDDDQIRHAMPRSPTGVGDVHAEQEGLVEGFLGDLDPDLLILAPDPGTGQAAPWRP